MALAGATMPGKTQPAQIQEVDSSLERAEAKLAPLTQALAQAEPNTVSTALTSYLEQFAGFTRASAGSEAEKRTTHYWRR